MAQARATQAKIDAFIERTNATRVGQLTTNEYQKITAAGAAVTALVQEAANNKIPGTNVLDYLMAPETDLLLLQCPRFARQTLLKLHQTRCEQHIPVKVVDRYAKTIFEDRGMTEFVEWYNDRTAMDTIARATKTKANARATKTKANARATKTKTDALAAALAQSDVFLV